MEYWEGKAHPCCCTDAFLQEDLALFSSSTVLPSAKRSSVADVPMVDTVDGLMDG